MPNTNPRACAYSTMAFNSNLNNYVLLNTGTFPAASGALPQTYTWNGTDWSLRSGTVPPARTECGMAFDGDGGAGTSASIVLFGGRGWSSGTYLNDTWLWNDATEVWSQAFPANSPSGRAKSHVAKLFNGANHRGVLLYGGVDNQTMYADTWIWTNGNNWTQITSGNVPGTVNPPSRVEGMLASGNSQVFLFGGENQKFCLNDLWQFNPTTLVWSQLSPANPPPARYGAVFGYDQSNALYVLFGGRNYNQLLNDTWTYDPVANAWTQHFPATAPSCRYAAQMNVSGAAGGSNNLLFFGGLDYYNCFSDTWIWNPNTLAWNQK